MSRDGVLALIDEKKKEGRGMLSDEGAARLVAEELLVQTRGTELGRMQVKDLVSGLNDVGISGRVLMVWPPQQFQRRDGTPGRIMRLVLVDRSGRVRCAFWDRHVDVLTKAGNLQGRLLRIGHAYTRQGLAGDAEVHVGERSSVEINPQDMTATDFPEFKELFTPLSKLTADTYQLNIVGIVQAEPRHYTFQKEDRVGSVLRTVVADDSGAIPLVAWNERAEELRNIKRGDVLQVLNARTRLDSNSRPELHAESRSQVEILLDRPEFLKMPTAKSYKLAELNGQVGSVDLLVTVLAKGPLRQVTSSTGDDVKVARLIVSDESGIAPLSLWDDKADLLDRVMEGDSVELRGATVRERLGEVNLNLGKSGELHKSTKTLEVKPPTKLDSIQSAKGLLIVEGTVSDQPLTRQVATDRGETVSLSSFTLRDDTGAAKATFWREQVDLVAKLRPGMRVRIVGVRVRAGLSGDPELSSVPGAKIEAFGPPAKDRPAWEDIRHVIALEPGLKTWVKGVILEPVGDSTLVAICETCSSTLNVSNGNFNCENCKSSKLGNVRFVTRLKIDDGTGVAEIIVTRLDPSPFISLNEAGARESMLKQGKPELIVDKEELSKMTGKEIEVYGTAEAAGTLGKFQVNAEKVLPASKLQ